MEKTNKNWKLLFAFLVISLSCCVTDKAPDFNLIISNVNLIDGTGSDIKNHVNVYIKDSKISRIDTIETKFDTATNVIDGEGKYLIPGLFDSHAHTELYRKDFEKFIHFGVTSIFMPGGSKASNDYYRAMRTLAKQNSIPAPRVYHTSQHFTMEGRHPVKTYPEGNWVEGKTVYYLRDTLQIAQIVDKVANDTIQGIKLTIEEGPTPPFVSRMPQEFVDKVASEARKHGLPVFVHVSDNEELRMALKAGISNIIHFTGVDIDIEKEQQLTDSIVQANVSWVSTLMLDKKGVYPLHPQWAEAIEALNVYSKDELAMLKDSAAVARAEAYFKMTADFYQLETPSFKGIIIPQVRTIKGFYDRGVNMVLGTDTGNTFIFPGYSLHEEMQLMQLGGMAPVDIIKMGTLNAAKMLEVTDQLGSIEVGKFADMVLLDENPLESISNTLKINSVFKNGKMQARIK